MARRGGADRPAAFAARKMHAPKSGGERADRVQPAGAGMSRSSVWLATFDDSMTLARACAAPKDASECGSMLAIVSVQPYASGAGLSFAWYSARAEVIPDAGFVIVSGLACGIDQAAHSRQHWRRHRGGAGWWSTTGSTCLGTKICWPRSWHRAGLRFPNCCEGIRRAPGDLPRRYWLIPKAALGVVVVEWATFARDSGAIMTAQIAAEDVRPGSGLLGVSPLEYPRVRGTERI